MGINAIEAALEQHDASLIVIDEVVGQCVVVTLLDVFLRGAVDTTLLLLLSFLGFRLFDIVKPWPVGWVDNKVEGGLGVMLDDVVAALLAVPYSPVAICSTHSRQSEEALTIAVDQHMTQRAQ